MIFDLMCQLYNNGWYNFCYKTMINSVLSWNLKIKKIALVHGEEDQILSFAETLKKEGFSVVVPRQGESIEVK